jgi:uncharacterized membrane protein YbhN (UPF0104 family)
MSRVLAGAGILGLLGWRFGSEPVVAAMRVLDGATLVAVVSLGALTTVFSAWRWTVVAQGLGLRIPLAGAIAEYYRSLFVNAVLPGGVIGDAHRALTHGQAVGDVPRAVKAVVLERAAGQAVLGAAALAVLGLDRPRLPSSVRAGSPVAMWTVTIGATIIALIAVAAGMITARRLLGRGAAPRWVVVLWAWGGDVRRALLTGGRRWRILLASAAVLAGHLTTFLIAARAAGSTASLLRLVPLLLLALVAMSLPLNIGGWGPREGAMAWAFGTTGLSASQGLTVALTYGLCTCVASLPGAGVVAGRRIALARSGRRARRRLAATGSGHLEAIGQGVAQ